MTFINTVEFLNMCNNVAMANRAFSDPNSSRIEKFDGAINAFSAIATFVGPAISSPGGLWTAGLFGVAVSKVNLMSSFGQFSQSLSSLKADSSDQNINKVVQDFGGLLGAIGGAMYSTAAMTRNPYLFGIGLILETAGNGIKEGNKWSAEHPTDFFDSFFAGAEAIADLAVAAGDAAVDRIAHSPIANLINIAYITAQNISQVRRDPLTLDLDGDGIETVGTSAAVLFDHDGDGTKTGTGWIHSDDGFLVMDRNGNGVIDNGTELFGDSTNLYGGGKAVDGFAALRQEDTNADGKVNSQDSRWNQLRIWRALNQDGISQASELSSMAQIGIASINTSAAENSRILQNGNQIADLGTFTWADGRTGTTGEVNNLADVDLVEDTFHREFTNVISLASGVADLPEKLGSGLVRDLHEAASLSTTLHALLTQASQATDRRTQLDLIDDVLSAWADTAGLTSSMQVRAGSQYTVVIEAIGSQTSATSTNWAATTESWNNKLHTLEAFNGRYFFNLPGQAGVNLSNSSSLSWATQPNSSTGLPQLNVRWSQEQVNLLNTAYDDLLKSLYKDIATQTRLLPLFDQVTVANDGELATLDFSALEQHFKTSVAGSTVNGLEQLIEFNQLTKEVFKQTSWNGSALQAEIMSTAVTTPSLLSLYAEMGVQVVAQPNVSIQGLTSNETIVAHENGSPIYANAGDDILVGRAGNDTLVGGAGNDILIGGAGNDALDGGTGSDTYLFGRGSGQDAISVMLFDMSGSNAGKIDVLQLGANIVPADVTLSRSGADLTVAIIGTTDKMTVRGYFNYSVTAPGVLEEIRFANGTVWNGTYVRDQLLIGTAAAETIYGYASDDVINAGAGNDTLNGEAGNDTLNGEDGDDWTNAGDGNDTINGGTGADTIYAGYGNDILNGGAGNDRLIGEQGNDVLDGGAGNDVLAAGAGNDIYLFGRGSGQDSIDNFDSGVGKLDILRFAADVVPADVVCLRNNQNLILSIVGTTDQVTITNYFNNDGVSSNQLEQITFADGTIWDLAAIKPKVIAGNSSDQTLVGFATDDTINAGAGMDNVSGGAGNDTLNGENGDDTLSGETGNDTLNGGAGADRLYGNDGDDVISGNSENDSLYGGSGNDILSGGTGNDVLRGEIGNDVYLFARGDGQDQIENYEYGAPTTKVDILRFASNIAPADITCTRNYDDLVLTINGTTDKVTVANALGADGTGAFKLERIEFADGTFWDIAAVKAKVLVGTAAGQTLYGYASDDTINAGGGDDAVNGYGGNDTINGQDGNDSLYGGDGNDVLTGGLGNDYLEGGNGSDTYHFSRGSGQDTISNYDTTTGKTDVLQFGSDILATDVTAARVGNNVVLTVNGTTDKVTLQSYMYGDPSNAYKVDKIQFADGTLWDAAAVRLKVLTGTAAAETLYGYASADTINAGSGNDFVYGGAGNDIINGEDGNDTLQGDEGNDTMSGGAGVDTMYGRIGNDIMRGDSGDDYLTSEEGNDFVDGGGENDSIYGGDGIDIMQGGSGGDYLSDTVGNNLFNGGTGIDTLIGGTANEMFIGGTDNDTITTGTGYDILAFNRGHGADIVKASTGKDNTVSLGGGIAYADLLFSKSGNNLILKTGATDQVTFQDWYTSLNNRSVANLQIGIEGTADYNAASTSQINNKKVEQFNFDGLATKFDQALAANPTLTSWSLSSSLLEFHLAGSDTAARGGDLAYQYAKNGDLANVSVTPAQALLGSTQFGTANQALQATTALADLSPRLA